ncbi:MAG: hypothetical protein KGI00_05070 [Candidatus Micrarchaeota archaeon]|nr:hypothetical protein [Candidatus Micrarchaeota archaeon]MDE1824586.1 hypothetical protein [Candidatus Micrarchaeota archaeon]MDE1850070.1 hypothetical protein [Candidatus Micrarchaeota archaeon]
MDLWQSYMGYVEDALGSKRIELRTGQRWNSSLVQVLPKSVDIGKGMIYREYSEFGRYITVKDLTYDLFVSLYDVNSRSCVAMRLSDTLPQKELDAALAPLKRLPRKNIEARAIGMQDGHAEQAGALMHIRRALKCSLLEVDMFGADTRHIVIDLGTGASYNLLLLNRIYRPGELRNLQTYEMFRQQLGSKAPGK